MTYECPRGLTEPPTCTHPEQAGLLHFRVFGEDSSVGAGPLVECDEQTCTCDLTPEEWAVLQDRAAQAYYEDWE